VSYYRKFIPLHSVGMYKMVKAKLTLAQAMKAYISLSYQKKKRRVTLVYTSCVT